MAARTVVGIDFATKDAGTCAAFGQVGGSSKLEITRIEPGIGDQRIMEIAKEEHAVVAIDIPFGWPEQFVAFIAQYHGAKGGPEVADNYFRYRFTDRFVYKKLRKWPLSVSTDKIGMPRFVWRSFTLSWRIVTFPRSA